MSDSALGPKPIGRAAALRYLLANVPPMDAPTAAPLTPTQTRVLRHVAEHIVQWQRPPTRLAIARHFGWASPNAAEEHLQQLVRKGYIELDAADCNAGRGARYVRVVRWPAAVLPVIHLSASPEGPAHALAHRNAMHEGQA